MTVINVCETKPEQQQELIERWIRLLKEQRSYGKALLSQYFRAYQQHHDHIFVAPGH